MASETTFSVIIPTYRRPLFLLKTIKGLQNQKFSNFEVIVVDNAADNKIKHLIEKFNRTAKVKSRYLKEPRLGAHNARHLGAKAAKGEILVFIEDMVLFDKNWLFAYAEAFKKHSEMAAAGGPIKPKWLNPPPGWLKLLTAKSRSFTPLTLFEPYKKFTLSPKGSFFAINFAIKRQVFFKLGGFNPDAIGKKHIGDGETGLNRKLWKNKLEIGFVPQAIIYHKIEKERMSPESIKVNLYNTGIGDIYTLFHENKVPTGLFGLTRYIIPLAYINLKYTFAMIFFKSFKVPVSLKLKFQLARANGQISYIREVLKNKATQRLIARKNWL